MPVLALVPSVWTLPEPAVLLVLDRVEEVLADDFGGFVEVGGVFAVFFGDGFFELGLVPGFHGV